MMIDRSNIIHSALSLYSTLYFLRKYFSCNHDTKGTTLKIPYITFRNFHLKNNQPECPLPKTTSFTCFFFL